METLLEDVSAAAYDKAVEVVTDVVRTETRKEDMRMIEDTKKWVLSPEHKAPQTLKKVCGAAVYLFIYCSVSLVRRRRQTSSFTSSSTTAVSGMKKRMPRMPKSLPPIMAATRVYRGESPTDLPTTRG